MDKYWDREKYRLKNASVLFLCYYRPQRSWAKVMFLQASVILSTGGEGVCLSACWDARPPQSRHPPGSRHPSEQTPSPPLGPGTPQTRHPPGADTPRPVTHPPPQDQAHPPGADTRIWSMSGRYASYWNAFFCFFC